MLVSLSEANVASDVHFRRLSLPSIAPRFVYLCEEAHAEAPAGLVYASLP